MHLTAGDVPVNAVPYSGCRTAFVSVILLRTLRVVSPVKRFCFWPFCRTFRLRAKHNRVARATVVNPFAPVACAVSPPAPVVNLTGRVPGNEVQNVAASPAENHETLTDHYCYYCCRRVRQTPRRPDVRLCARTLWNRPLIAPHYMHVYRMISYTAYAN